MNRFAIGADRRCDHATELVLRHLRLGPRRCATLDGEAEHFARIVHPERDVFHAVAMLLHMLVDPVPGIKRAREHESDFVLLQHIRAGLALARLGTAIGDQLIPERAAVEVRRLLRVADEELDVVGTVDRERVERGRCVRPSLSRHQCPASRKLRKSSSLNSVSPRATLLSFPCFIHSSSRRTSSNMCAKSSMTKRIG